MIDGQPVIAVIAARGGSKGFPRKNIADFGGKPLIAWTIAAAARSKLLDRAVVSTDNAEIAGIARHWQGDVPFLRPAPLATDDASVTDAVLHAIDTLAEPCRYVVLLQATSPLRTGEDIDNAITLCHRRHARSCVSLSPVEKGPQWMFKVEGGKASPLTFDVAVHKRRQELPIAYLPNGAIYVAESNWLKTARTFYGDDTAAYIMPVERSVDIDSQKDLWIAEAFLRHMR